MLSLQQRKQEKDRANPSQPGGPSSRRRRICSIPCAYSRYQLVASLGCSLDISHNTQRRTNKRANKQTYEPEFFQLDGNPIANRSAVRTPNTPHDNQTKCSWLPCVPWKQLNQLKTFIFYNICAVLRNAKWKVTQCFRALSFLA